MWAHNRSTITRSLPSLAEIWLAVSCSWHKVSKCLEQSLEHQCFFGHNNTAEISRLVKKVKSTCRPLWELFFFSLKKLVHHADWSMKKNFSAFFYAGKTSVGASFRMANFPRNRVCLHITDWSVLTISR